MRKGSLGIEAVTGHVPNFGSMGVFADLGILRIAWCRSFGWWDNRENMRRQLCTGYAITEGGVDDNGVKLMLCIKVLVDGVLVSTVIPGAGRTNRLAQ